MAALASPPRPPACRGALAAAVLLTALSASRAAAHDADVLYVLARPGAGDAEVVEVVTLTSATLGLLAPVDADGDGLLTQADLDARARAVRLGVWEEMPLAAGGLPCALLEVQARLRETFVELTGQWQCGAGELRQDFRVLRVLPTNYRVVLGSQLDGERNRAFAQGSLTALTVPRPPRRGAWDVGRFGAGVRLGLRRTLAPVALLSLAALLLGAGSWRRGARLGGLLAAGVLIGAWVPAPPGWSAGALALGAVLSSTSSRGGLALAALTGVALGLGAAGEGWPGALGAALGHTAALLGLVPGGVALGRLLARRPRAQRLTRTLAAAGALGALVVGAR